MWPKDNWFRLTAFSLMLRVSFHILKFSYNFFRSAKKVHIDLKSRTISLHQALRCPTLINYISGIAEYYYPFSYTNVDEYWDLWLPRLWPWQCFQSHFRRISCRARRASNFIKNYAFKREIEHPISWKINLRYRKKKRHKCKNGSSMRTWKNFFFSF